MKTLCIKSKVIGYLDCDLIEKEEAKINILRSWKRDKQ